MMKTIASGITIRAVRNFRMGISRVDGSPAGEFRQWLRRPQSTGAKRLGAGLGRTAFAVQPFAHFLAGLEERDALLVDRHMRAGARIAAGAGGAMLDRERAETAQFDPVAARQGGHDLI